MHLDLTDEEREALIRHLRDAIDGDRYFMSPRVKLLQAILDKLVPPAPKPAPPPEPRGRMVPPRATARQRRR